MKRALLVIDVQNEYFTGGLRVTYPENSFENILKVIDSANDKEVPVILIQHASLSKNSETFIKWSHEWEIHEEVLKKRHDCIIEKNLPGSFTGTELNEFLKSKGIDTIVICGYMTQMCCDTTSRQAVDLGYNVEFLSDATGTLDISNYAGAVSAEELQRSILVTQAMRFSKVISSDEWIGIIDRERFAQKKA